MLSQPISYWLRVGLAVFVVGGALLGLAIAVYATHIRRSASALIDSARQISTTADAEREIAAWQKRSGKEFWTESDHPGEDHNYDGQIENLALARLRVVQPTVLTVGITMHDGKLRCVTIIESTGWYPVASVWIQEWFDAGMPNRFHVGSNRKPSVATVEFPASLPDDQRTKAFAVNTRCLVQPSGCKTAEDILPGVWQLESEAGPK
jgi:hypothetical protein